MSNGVNDELAAIAAALASPTRLRALNMLFQGPKTVEGLAELLGESRANTTAHLKALRRAGLVTSVREGKYAVQQISDGVVLELFLALRAAGERLSSNIRLVNEQPDEATSAVTFDELEALTGAGKIILVDLRPVPEYARGHLPGARSFPLETLPERVRELPSRRRILAYCRGKYCPNARRGVSELRRAGLRAERLRFGVPEWRASGRALEEAVR